MHSRSEISGLFSPSTRRTNTSRSRGVRSWPGGGPWLAARISAGGTPSFVTDGVSGLLYRAGDASALVDRIERVFADDCLAESLGRGGSRQARSRGDQSGLTDMLVRIYEEVLG